MRYIQSTDIVYTRCRDRDPFQVCGSDFTLLWTKKHKIDLSFSKKYFRFF